MDGAPSGGGVADVNAGKFVESPVGTGPEMVIARPGGSLAAAAFLSQAQ
ncbi:MAG: hypothetical protein OXM62_05000 [bacterium]|nr:hypothetical protein [bacterium]